MIKPSNEQTEILNSLFHENIKVDAVAGSGKTTTLVLAYLQILETLMKNYDINSALSKILVLTFSNEAAYDIKEKITKELAKYQYYGPVQYVSTIHSFANAIFKDLVLPLHINPDYEINNAYESKLLREHVFETVIVKSREVYQEILKLFAFEPEGKMVRDLIFYMYEKSRSYGLSIEELKAKMTLPEEYLSILNFKEEVNKLMDSLWKLFEMFYHEYETQKYRSGIMEYDDLVYYTHQNFNKYCAKKWKGKFEYILVDEYQDTSILQLDLIFNNIGDENTHYLMAGDYFQSIYEWRDAHPEYSKNLQLKSKVITQNFRTTKKIVQFLNPLFENLFKDLSTDYKDLKSESSSSSDIFIFQLSSKKVEEMRAEEADNFAKSINHMVNSDLELDVNESGKIKYKDIAILFRAKMNINTYTNTLRKYRIPYVFVSGEEFYKREEVRDMISYLRVLEYESLTPASYLYFAEVLTSPMYRGDYSTIWYLGENRKDLNNTIDNISVPEKHRKILKKFQSDFKVLEKLKFGRKDLLLLKILKLTRIDLYYLKYRNEKQRFANLYKLVDIVRIMEEREILDYSTFLKRLIEKSAIDQENDAIIADNQENAVRISTVHGSKGLQYPVVFVADMFRKKRTDTFIKFLDRNYGFLIDESIVSGTDESKLNKFIKDKKLTRSLEEEFKRLLYVALTRAQRYLLFSIDSSSNKKQQNWCAFIKTHSDHSLLTKYVENAKTLIQESEKKSFEKIQKIEKEISYTNFDTTSQKLFSITPTMINTYMICPKKYWYESIYGTGIDSAEIKLGSLIHQLLESGEAEDSDLYEKAREKVNAFFGTSLWNRIKDSNHYKELQFAVNLDGTLLAGSIDLVYEDERGWHVIDYKSTDNNVEKYMGQLMCYVIGFEKKTGKCVTDVSLYSINKNEQSEIKNVSYSKAVNTVSDIIKNIENQKFESRHGTNCNLCQFRAICDQKDYEV